MQDLSFSWSFESSAPPASGGSDGRLFVLAPCTHYPLPDNRVLLIRRFSEARGVVTGEVLHALGVCTTFRTLEQHAQMMVATFPGLIEGVEDARQVLEALRQGGLFLSSAEIETALARPPSEPNTVRRVTICLPTADRPALLERVLVSLGTQQREGDIRYYVIDDSRQAANIAKNRQITQQQAKHQGIALHYFGPEQQQQQVTRLQQRLPRWASEVEFLLGRFAPESVPSYGRSLNHALLLSRGGALVYIDDDTLCQGYAPSVATLPQVALGGGRRECDFLQGERAWEQQGTPLDPVTEFGRFIGRSPLAVAAELQQQGNVLSLEGMITPQATALLAPTSRIAAVTCGLYGDPGTGGHQWLFELQGPSRERLLRDEASYRRALHERNVWMGVSRHQFTPGHSLLSINKCIDHSRLLPPAFPLLRNEDLLFGRMLAMLHPDSLFLELPWAVPHLPATPRNWPEDLLEQPMLLGFSRLSALHLSQREAALVTRDPSARLGLIGDFLSDLGGADQKLLQQQVSEGLARVRAELINRLHYGLQGDVPAYYRRDVLRQIEANERVLLSSGSAGPYDLFEAFPERDPVATAQLLWQRFADAIYAWEDILHASGNP